MGWTMDEGELLSLIFLLLCDFVGICESEREGVGGGGGGGLKQGQTETHRQR